VLLVNNDDKRLRAAGFHCPFPPLNVVASRL
jgi:hypothetical protein